MRKNKILLSVLIFGLLLCGIGGGVMFGEFSKLNYSGEYVYHTDTPQTDTVTISLKECPDGPINVSCWHSDCFPVSDHFVVDDTLEEGIVQIKVTYDPCFVSPDFDIISTESTSEFPFSGNLELNFHSRTSDIGALFKIKDMVLNDLKSNTLKSYYVQNIWDLTISAAPKTAERLSA